MEDSISKALRLVLADDRKRPDDEDSVEKLWRQQFRDVKGEDLLRAVGIWLDENPRGRPNVGKIREILQRFVPAVERRKAQADDERRRELVWAVSVLSDAHRYSQYPSTLSYAQKCLEAQGYTAWQEAKSHLEPGWVPNLTNEAYL